MDEADRVVRRRTLKERLRLKGLGCCGSTWGFRSPPMTVTDDEDEEEGPQLSHHQNIEEAINPGRVPPPDPGCAAGSGMNLATALAVERQFRSTTQDSDGAGASPVRPRPSDGTSGTAPGTPFRMSLLRLLEETDGGDGETERGLGGVGNDTVCCVCMGRKKGAAFIPCGHTFCRVCSRELWLNRGSCPLCNRSILEILDIF